MCPVSCQTYIRYDYHTVHTYLSHARYRLPHGERETLSLLHSFLCYDKQNSKTWYRPQTVEKNTP
uniref:Uncharacterized protein n=1 Tax=Anguilla anguilla TaxID=7936 RepID=A0A0E9QVB0_ANGAN